jgi:Transcriptional activator TraM
MTASTEKFRQQLQKDLGLTIGPKDPLLAEWLAHEEFKEELAAEHQRMLVAFEEALRKNEALWVESAKTLANQSLNAALRAARESTATLIEEAGRSNAAVLRRTVQDGVQELEKALEVSRRIAWVSIAASVLALAASAGLLLERLLH